MCCIPWRTPGSGNENKKRRGLAAPPLSSIKLRCLHHLLHSFIHLFRRHILHVSGDTPEMSEGILNDAIAVSIKLVLHGLQDFRALSRCALNYAVGVGKVHVQAYRTPTDG